MAILREFGEGLMFKDAIQGAVPTYLILRVLTGDSIGGVTDWNFWLLVVASIGVGIAAWHFSIRADGRARQARSSSSKGTDE